MVAAGLISYGGVHLVVAWLFAQVAWGWGMATSEQPITAMARTRIGQAALWVAAAGMAILIAWRVLQVVSRSDRAAGWRAVGNAATRLFEATIYALIGISAVQAAVTRGRKGSIQAESAQEQSLGTVMLHHTWSRVALGAIAVLLFALGVQLLRSAVTRAFTQDLAERVPLAVVAIGAIGTMVKGVAVVIVSVLIGWAVVTFDPAKTAGLEALLQTLRQTWFGPVLLTVIAVGLACYGVYCFVWAAHPRR